VIFIIQRLQARKKIFKYVQNTSAVKIITIYFMLYSVLVRIGLSITQTHYKKINFFDLGRKFGLNLHYDT